MAAAGTDAGAVHQMLKTLCSAPITCRKRTNALIVQGNNQSTGLEKKFPFMAIVTDRAIFVVLILGEGAFG